MEKGVAALLESHGLSDKQVALSEQLALADVDEEEVKRRTAELRKMRDVLFHHERNLKRASKIKSKAYRKSHKKEKALRAEMEQQIASLDKQTAQKLQLRREMERVRERMTLKHKNTSKWAKKAVKMSQKNHGLRAAVAEQLAKGEELRRKQMDGGIAKAEGDEDDEDEDEFSDSEEEEGDSEEEGEDGGEEGEEGWPEDDDGAGGSRGEVAFQAEAGPEDPREGCSLNGLHEESDREAEDRGGGRIAAA